MAKCLICKHDYDIFISFGRMPIANGFLRPDQFDDEYFFELQVGICPACKMVQLVDQPPREMMFHDEYAYFSSTSLRQTLHFRDLAEKVIRDNSQKKDPFIVELGSNDGILLQNFAQKGIRHLGVEPSQNVARAAITKGVNTISEFFDEDLANRLIAEHGQADTILAANVMCHIPYLHSVLEGIKVLLKNDGIFIFEDPYLGDIVEKTSYDQIYDEHVFYFSVASITYLFDQHDMEIVDVEPLNVHGGSMRFYIAHKGSHSIATSVRDQRDKEKLLGLQLEKTYDLVRGNIEKSRDKLLALLQEIRFRQKKRIVGYGATSKSTTVTNYCGIGPDLVEFISDTTPNKQGKFSPGTHIPVLPYQNFTNAFPDYALLFAWNHAEEIMEKEMKFNNSRGKWIRYVPDVRVIS